MFVMHLNTLSLIFRDIAFDGKIAFRTNDTSTTRALSLS